MQSTCLQPSGGQLQYQPGLYRPQDVFEPTMKLQHAPDLGDSFSNYLTTSRAPPSYESTMFAGSPLEPVPNSSTSYYKVASQFGPYSSTNILTPLTSLGADKNYFSEGKPEHLLEFSPNSSGNIINSELKADDTSSKVDDDGAKCEDAAQVSSTDKTNDNNSVHDPTSNTSEEETALLSLDKVADDKSKAPSDQKPALSYIALIAKAILECPEKRLSLGSIYAWIEKYYPYFKNKGQGWRNSVRHNLSLNDCFIKAGRCEDGKGNYWSIHPANLQDFMRGDFRQRRRSRRRGRKKDCEFAMHNGYMGQMGAPSSPLSPTMPFSPVSPTSTLSSIYSPYTEAERRAYRLDEVLLRQSMNNPFMKWYHNGVGNGGYSPNTCSSLNNPAPPNPCASGMYNTPQPACNTQWQSGYPTDNSTQSYYPLTSSFSRFVK